MAKQKLQPEVKPPAAPGRKRKTQVVKASTETVPAAPVELVLQGNPPAQPVGQSGAQQEGDPLQQLKDDFRNFVFAIWKHLGLPVPTWVQYDIAVYLQRGPRRRIVKAFRGVGKSWITAALVLWFLFKDPNERIMVVSASKDRADAFAIFVKRLIEEVPFLQHLRPREGQRDSVVAFDVGPSEPHQAPSVRSVGITGQMTGGRATKIIADDVEVPKNSLTQTMRDRLAELVKEFDAILAPGGEVIFLGTDQTEMGLYSRLPERGYDVRIWPARYPSTKIVQRIGQWLAPSVLEKLSKDPTLAEAYEGKGFPTDPDRFDHMDLLEREASYGRSGFAMQFMLDPSVSDSNRYPLRLSDLIVMDVSPTLAPVGLAWGTAPAQVISDIPVVGLSGDKLYSPMYVSEKFAEYQGIVMAIDPAGMGGDELGYAIVGMLYGYLFVMRVKGLRGGYSDENLQTLANEAKRFKVKHILIEENYGDGMFTKLLTPFLARTYPCSTEEVKHSIQKEKRILDVMEPVMNQHKLVMDRKVLIEDQEDYNEYGGETAHLYQLAYQMTRLTRDRQSLKKDDRVDVLSMAVQYWVDQMDVDKARTEASHKEKLLQEELRKFKDHVFGMPKRTGRSFNRLR